MKNSRTVIAYLTIATRLPSSVNGNGRFQVLLRGAKVDGVRTTIVACTAVDSGLCHGITNHTGWTVRATIGEHYGTTTIIDVENLERGEAVAFFQAHEDNQNNAI